MKGERIMETKMKRTYETPVAEKIEFCYKDQVVASGTTSGCISVWMNTGADKCTSGNSFLKPLN